MSPGGHDEGTDGSSEGDFPGGGGGGLSYERETIAAEHLSAAIRSLNLRPLRLGRDGNGDGDDGDGDDDSEGRRQLQPAESLVLSEDELEHLMREFEIGARVHVDDFCDMAHELTRLEERAQLQHQQQARERARP